MTEHDQTTATATAPPATATATDRRGTPQDARRRSRLQQNAEDHRGRTSTRVPHAKFGKIVKQVKKFYAHDEENKAQAGDTVRIAETRPLSKLKRWRLVEIIKH